jgi:hypothetical protein
VVLAVKVALVKVYGVFVIIVKGTLPVPTFSFDNMLRFGSVILTSKRPLGFVVGGFCMLLIVILKVCSGLIPVKGGLIPMTTLTPLVTNAK